MLRQWALQLLTPFWVNIFHPAMFCFAPSSYFLQRARAKHCWIPTSLILGGSAGGIVALILSYIEQKKWSYLVTLNGALTGKKRGFKI